MAENEYSPYLRREDAIEEYKSLRTEILESQKQRISLLQYSIILFAALFGYLIKDGSIQPQETLFLVVISIASSLFSYSTRCRERRIAHYLCTYLKAITPWSGLSSGKDENGLTLKFLQRTSTTIILMMILLNFILLSLGWPSNWTDKVQTISWISALIFSFANVYIAYLANNLGSYKEHFQKELQASK